jgi:hypothetical protein
MHGCANLALGKKTESEMGRVSQRKDKYEPVVAAVYPLGLFHWSLLFLRALGA